MGLRDEIPPVPIARQSAHRRARHADDRLSYAMLRPGEKPLRSQYGSVSLHLLFLEHHHVKASRQSSLGRLR